MIFRCDYHLIVRVFLSGPLLDSESVCRSVRDMLVKIVQRAALASHICWSCNNNNENNNYNNHNQSNSNSYINNNNYQ